MNKFAFIALSMYTVLIIIVGFFTVSCLLPAVSDDIL